jgi:hypothetical protein
LEIDTSRPATTRSSLSVGVTRVDLDDTWKAPSEPPRREADHHEPVSEVTKSSGFRATNRARA